MNVTLPNGTVIQGVPEGTTKQQVMEKAISSGLATQADFGQQPAKSTPSGAVTPTTPPQQDQQQPQQPQQRSLSDMSPLEIAEGVGETAAKMVTGTAADVYGGLKGGYQALTGDLEGGAKSIKEAEKDYTYQPRTEAGKAIGRGIGKVVGTVMDPVQHAADRAADHVLKITGSPEAAAIVQSLPQSALILAPELAGAKGLAGTRAAAMEERGIASAVPKVPKEERLPSSPKKAVSKAAPSVENLKSESRKIYKDLDDAGVTVNQEQYADLVDNINQDVVKEGHHPKLTPKVQGALDAMTEKVGEPMKVSEIETMRKIAGHAKSSMEQSEARLGARMQDHIDDFMDKQEGPDMPKARNLWGRARRADMIDEAMQKAANQASGFENGIRTQLRSLTNNKKKMKGFSKEDKAAIDKVVQGGRMENLFKLGGKFGFSEGQRTNALMSIVGAGAGGVAGGWLGAIAVPAIGQVSMKLAQRLTKSNSEMANAIVRSGDNATEVAKAYLKYTPKKDWRASELTQLLINPRVDIDSLRNIRGTGPLIDNAKLYAKELKKKGITSAAIAQFMNEKSEQHGDDVERILSKKS